MDNKNNKNKPEIGYLFFKFIFCKTNEKTNAKKTTVATSAP